VIPDMRFDDNDGVVATDVCLIEDEGLLFGGSPFVFLVLQQRTVQSLLFDQFLLQKADFLEQGLFFLQPFLLLRTPPFLTVFAISLHKLIYYQL
jgi:hypothetical protein